MKERERENSVVICGRQQVGSQACLKKRKFGGPQFRLFSSSYPSPPFRLPLPAHPFLFFLSLSLSHLPPPPLFIALLLLPFLFSSFFPSLSAYPSLIIPSSFPFIPSILLPLRVSFPPLSHLHTLLSYISYIFHTIIIKSSLFYSCTFDIQI